jgi:type II secretory pathway component PulK
MRTCSNSRAAVLLIVLWALILLSAAVLTWANLIHQDIEFAGRENRELEAKAMAHSGLSIALHPLVSRKTPLLEEQLAADMGFRVKIIGEGGKLNINWLIGGEDQRKLTLLKQWLEQMGLNFQEREMFVDCLLDYVDGDDVKRLNGVEDTDSYHPANRPLQSVDELIHVANAELLTSHPGWREQLTIYSQGPIDLTAADENILRLLPGIGEARMQRFLIYRRGKDGEDGTLDDPDFKSIKEVFSYLGISDAQGKELGGLITVKDQTMHITSEGIASKVVRQVEVVARKGGANPAILYWKE